MLLSQHSTVPGADLRELDAHGLAREGFLGLVISCRRGWQLRAGQVRKGFNTMLLLIRVWCCIERPFLRL